MASPYRFGVVIDGYVLPASPAEIFAQGRQNDVPTITGCNMHEGGATPRPNITAEAFRKQAQQRFQQMAEEFLKLYPAETDEQARISQNESSWDQARVSMYLWALHRAMTTKTKAYTYFWDHTLPGPDAGTYGAFHTSEVPYVMNTLYMSDRPFTAEDHRIADMMSDYWANFIRTGNPNGKGLAAWPAVDEKPGATMELGDKTAVIPVAGDKAKFSFFERYFTQQRTASQPR